MNGGQCVPGVDDDGNGQEDCDCSTAIGFEGDTCETATGSKLLMHTYIHKKYYQFQCCSEHYYNHY